MNGLGFFILGIFAGWILEWLFFTFFVKQKQSPKSKPAAATAVAAKAEKQEKVAVEKAAKPAPVKPEVKATAAEKATPVATQPVSPAETAKAEAKDTTAKEASKVEANKEASESAADKEASEIVAETSEETETKAEEERVDDLGTLKGIGPKLAESLNTAGIKNFEQLSKLKGEDILARLEATGAKVVNKPALANLAAQAKLAAKEDWDGLEKLQKTL